MEVFTPEVSSAMRARRASKLSSKLKEWGFMQGSGNTTNQHVYILVSENFMFKKFHVYNILVQEI